MGTDWHPYVEEFADGAWRPKWKPIPHPAYWSEDIIESKIADGSANLLFPKITDARTQYKVLNDYYQRIPWTQVLSEFSDHPEVTYLWKENSYPKYWKQAHKFDLRTLNPFGDEFYSGDRFSRRDYYWFELFGIRTHKNPAVEFTPGMPGDLSPALAREWAQRGEHSPGHIGVADLIEAAPGLYQTSWLKRNVKNPKDCRLIFWFDS